MANSALAGWLAVTANHTTSAAIWVFVDAMNDCCMDPLLFDKNQEICNYASPVDCPKNKSDSTIETLPQSFCNTRWSSRYWFTEKQFVLGCKKLICMGYTISNKGLKNNCEPPWLVFAFMPLLWPCKDLMF